MKEVVFEVIISIIILALLVVVIQLFRGNLDIIGTTADKADKMDKVQSDSLGVNSGKSEVKGSDVVSTIRYYSNDNTVQIYVNGALCTNGSIPISIDEYEKVFSARYENDQYGKLQKVFYTKK